MKRLHLEPGADLSGLLLNIRRGAIVLLMLLGYAYSRLAGEAYALVAIGLISFAAVAQFAPAMLGGMFWKNGTRAGALAGLGAGFLLWAVYAAAAIVCAIGLAAGRVSGAGAVRHRLAAAARSCSACRGWIRFRTACSGACWSISAAMSFVSLWSRPGGIEKTQALLFVEADGRGLRSLDTRLWRGRASSEALLDLLRRFLGAARAEQAYALFLRERGAAQLPARDAELVRFAEIALAGAIGTASARAMVASVVDEEPLGPDEVLAILDETSQVIAYSRQLEHKSRALEAATAELREANAASDGTGPAQG